MQINFAVLEKAANFAFRFGTMAEWLGTGLQNLLQRFDSAWYLKKSQSHTALAFLFPLS